MKRAMRRELSRRKGTGNNNIVALTRRQAQIVLGRHCHDEIVTPANAAVLWTEKAKRQSCLAERASYHTVEGTITTLQSNFCLASFSINFFARLFQPCHSRTIGFQERTNLVPNLGMVTVQPIEFSVGHQIHIN